MRKNSRETFVRSSGNVYDDLGLPNPEERKAKAHLMRLIAAEIERRGLNQSQAAELIGMAQSDISNIVRGRGRTYSMDRLIEVLHGLGFRISIVAHRGAVDETIPIYA